MRNYVLSLLGLFISFQVIATPGGWMPTPKKISGIIIEGSNTNGTALILIEGGVPTNNIPSQCSNSPYNTIDLTTEKGRAILSVALSAKISATPVKLAVTCRGSRPFITHIWI